MLLHLESEFTAQQSPIDLTQIFIRNIQIGLFQYLAFYTCPV